MLTKLLVWTCVALGGVTWYFLSTRTVKSDVSNRPSWDTPESRGSARRESAVEMNNASGKEEKEEKTDLIEKCEEELSDSQTFSKISQMQTE